MTNTLKESVFVFVVYSARKVGFTTPKESPLPSVVDCYFISPLPFDISGLGGPIRSIRSSQYSSPDRNGARKPPHHEGGKGGSPQGG